MGGGVDYLYIEGFNGGLNGDPVQSIIDFTGIGTLNLLLLSLTISPLAEYLKFGQIIMIILLATSLTSIKARMGKLGSGA